MVEKISICMSEILAGLPRDDPDRPFVEKKLTEFRTYLLRPKENVQDATRQIKQLVNEDISKNGPLTAKVTKTNYKTWELHSDRYGQESVTNLLPISSRQFGPIIPLLIKRGIHTKQELVEKLPDDIQSIRNRLRGIGPYKAKFILAMRDLAIAEIRDTTSPTSNHPQT